jgi:hypothetical protein
MARAKYYSPRLDYSLISPLYRFANAQHITMTALASQVVAEGLSRIAEDETCIVAEEPPECDPAGQRGHQDILVPFLAGLSTAEETNSALATTIQKGARNRFLRS